MFSCIYIFRVELFRPALRSRRILGLKSELTWSEENPNFQQNLEFRWMRTRLTCWSLSEWSGHMVPGFWLLSSICHSLVSWEADPSQSCVTFLAFSVSEAKLRDFETCNKLCDMLKYELSYRYVFLFFYIYSVCEIRVYVWVYLLDLFSFQPKHRYVEALYSDW